LRSFHQTIRLCGLSEATERDAFTAYEKWVITEPRPFRENDSLISTVQASGFYAGNVRNLDSTSGGKGKIKLSLCLTN
jgi:hypothetical protein